MKDLLPAPHEDVIFIPDGTPPPRRAPAPAPSVRMTSLVTLDDIIAAVCDYLGVEWSEILGPKRLRVSLARELISFLARKHTKESLLTIAARLQRSHSIVYEGDKRVTTRMNVRVGLYYASDPPERMDAMTYAGVVEELEAKIANAGGRL